VKTKLLIAATLVAVAGALFLCNIETASGPTPYSVYDGQASSSSSVSCGKGTKKFIIPAGLVMTSIGQWVTIKPTTDTTTFMSGTITSYDRISGTLTVTITETNGFETYSKWNIVSGKTTGEVDPARQAYTDLGFGMFIHFNMSTFDRCCCSECYSVSGEWGLANVDTKQFSPTKLNCGQWADVAKSAGCTYMVLTAKHHDGFCLWPSKLTNYCVTNAGISRDVIREFVDSARTRGLKVGIYYSIRDLTNGFALSFIKGQLSELLTDYGEVICLWFDGWGWGPGYKRVPYDTVHALIKSIQPNCMIVENNHEFTTVHSEIIEYEMPIDGPPKLGNIRPAEGNEPIRADQCWFWHPNRECDIKSAQGIVEQLRENNSRNAAYLLDLTPDTTGLIPDCQVQRMKEVGQLLGVPQQ
jgi:alpha-L-fucosidase